MKLLPLTHLITFLSGSFWGLNAPKASNSLLGSHLRSPKLTSEGTGLGRTAAAAEFGL